MADTKILRHSITDHFYGEDHDHTHSADDDHDHDHDVGADGPIEGNAIWIQDNIQLTSVGIDIGSSGTQIVFSRLHMRRLGEDLSSRFFVVKRETLYQSPVALTPYLSEERIDDRAVGDIIDAAYTAAQLHPDQIDTGAVILTGEALRRENARAIGTTIAEIGGEFVCATAGHHMESLLAAYGSGAAKVSHDNDQCILNIDIGGGTTKLAIVKAGKVIETAAIHIGGRLLVVDEALRIARLDPAGKSHAARAGFQWTLGDSVTDLALDAVANNMADALVAVLLERPIPAPIGRLYLTTPLSSLDSVDGVMFSGGVGEYVYQREDREFGDLGKRLGNAIRARLDTKHLPWPVLPAGECIRATALGASEYSVQLSGNTVTISNPGILLPRKNLQVLQPEIELQDSVDVRAVAHAIRNHFEAFDLVEGDADVVLALHWRGDPTFARLDAFARAIMTALPRTIEFAKPIYIVLDSDVAQTLGGILKEDYALPSEVLVLDGVLLRDFDYIDLGRIRMPSNTVPVTIKSLVFSEDPRTPQRTPRHHDAHHHHEHGAHEHDHDHDHTHPHVHGPDGEHDHSHAHPQPPRR